MAEHRTYGTAQHSYTKEIPLPALEAARDWALRLHAGDAKAASLIEAMKLWPSHIEPADPRGVAGAVFYALLQNQDCLDGDPFGEVFGDYRGWVVPIWDAYEDDPGGVLPEGLEERAQSRLRAGLATPDDQIYLLRQAAAT